MTTHDNPGPGVSRPAPTFPRPAAPGRTKPLTYALHGLTISAYFPLDERPARTAGTEEIRLSWGKRGLSIPDRAPAGTLLAGYSRGAMRLRLAATKNGYTMRFPATCDFRISPDLSTIDVDTDRDADEGIVSLLFSGNVLSSILNLRGACVLHASAVQLHSFTVGFIGHSGSGKSSIAAALCAEGGKLVSDDTLRVEVIDGTLSCYAGGTRIRLRPNARWLADSFAPLSTRETVDGRLSLAPPTIDVAYVPLDALLVPTLVEHSAEQSLRRLSGQEALLMLLRNPRVAPWRTDDPIRRHFGVCAQIADRLPVFEVSVPWGKQMGSNLLMTLNQALDVS
jgi:hypothetical protein